MKRLLTLLVVLLPILGIAQVHLGISEKEIRDLHADKTFEVDYDDQGNKYISTFMDYGTFFYLFDQENGLCNVCGQQVNETSSLKDQVEVYNNKYVVLSDTEWKAYVQGGKVINIDLSYEEDNTHIFRYYVSSGFDGRFWIPNTDGGR